MWRQAAVGKSAGSDLWKSTVAKGPLGGGGAGGTLHWTSRAGPGLEGGAVMYNKCRGGCRQGMGHGMWRGCGRTSACAVCEKCANGQEDCTRNKGDPMWMGVVHRGCSNGWCSNVCMLNSLQMWCATDEVQEAPVLAVCGLGGCKFGLQKGGNVHSTLLNKYPSCPVAQRVQKSLTALPQGCCK